MFNQSIIQSLKCTIKVRRHDATLRATLHVIAELLRVYTSDIVEQTSSRKRCRQRYRKSIKYFFDVACNVVSYVCRTYSFKRETCFFLWVSKGLDKRGSIADRLLLLYLYFCLFTIPPVQDSFEKNSIILAV
jgi:hypothetical protein